MDRERAILTYSITHRETNEDILAPLPHKIQRSSRFRDETFNQIGKKSTYITSASNGIFDERNVFLIKS